MSTPLALELLREGKRVWPDIELDPDQVGGFLKQSHPALARDPSLHLADLYLACACLRGNVPALQQLEALCRSELHFVLHRLKTTADANETLNTLLSKLLCVGNGSAPKLAHYGGRSELNRWIRVVAVRHVVSQKRLQQREKLHTEAVLARIALGAVPHMGKDLAVRRAFKQALAKALGSLTLRERSLLGLRLDGLTLAELASAFDVQTCTVWRWLGRLNASVKNAILGELRKELRLNDEDLDSVVRSVLDRVDTSICRQVSRGVGAG